MIVEDHPVADPLTRLPPAREGMQVNALVLQRAPQPFDEDVVEEQASLTSERFDRSRRDSVFGAYYVLSCWRIDCNSC